MNIAKAIEIKLAWKKDNYPPPLADEINADNLSIEALKHVKESRPTGLHLGMYKLPGETDA